MCECYKIGGPWIAEDPDCPIHGTEAQREREDIEQSKEILEDRLAAIEEKLIDAMCRIRKLEKNQLAVQ